MYSAIADGNRRDAAGQTTVTKLTVHVLEVHLGTDVAHGFLHRAVIDGLLLCLREKVGHDAVEELQVVS